MVISPPTTSTKNIQRDLLDFNSARERIRQSWPLCSQRYSPLASSLTTFPKKSPKAKHSLNVNVPELGEFNAQVTVSCDSYAISIDGEHHFAVDAQALGGVDQVKQTFDFGGEDISTIQTIKNRPTGEITLQYLGTLFTASVKPSHVASYQKTMPEKPKIDESKFIRSPMPGTVISVNVQVGDVIAAGSEVAVLEAMKMQNSLTAVDDGTVKSVHVAPGDKMSDGDLLVEFE